MKPTRPQDHRHDRRVIAHTTAQKPYRAALTPGVRRVFALLLGLLVILAQIAPLLAQTPTPMPSPVPSPAATATPALSAEASQLDELADMLVDRMSPAERVGQLFVVTFPGNDVQYGSDIVDLVYEYHVGGVVLSPRNGNFSNERGIDTPRQVALLTNQLQAAAYGLDLTADSALAPVPLMPWPPEGFTYFPDVGGPSPSNLPLLIGVNQTGDGLPATALRRGFTPLPSPMAMGASWNREQVKAVGSVVGREIRTVGFNLLLGPALDVFNQKGVDRVSQLGLYSFGGNPYWVTQLGRAYIEGVHEGGGGRVATSAGNFPGQGSSDRIPSEEVATIQSSQAELRQGALQPFIGVTRQPSTVIDPEGDPGATDVLVTSHMRFSGLQGGAGRIAPLSLAPELRTILRQEGFEEWQNLGGVVMSGPLGVQAIRRYFEGIGEENFKPRLALDAFVAGNDLLFLSNFGLDDSWESQIANTVETISAFQERYERDPDFAALVDISVRRIVRLKLGLYREAIGLEAGTDLEALLGKPEPVIPLSKLLVTDTDLLSLEGEARDMAIQQMGQLARSAVTILYPDPSTQTTPVPPQFEADDKILVFTDFRPQRECVTCDQEPSLGPDEVMGIIASLYGLQSSGSIDPENVKSQTFVELSGLLDSLDAATGAPAPGSSEALTATATLTATVTATTPLLFPTPTATAAITPVVVPPTVPTPQGVTAPSDETTDVANDKTLAAIQEADWIIFVMLDVAPQTSPYSAAVKRLLSDHITLIEDQRLVVFALQAPYYLDATEMSKLTTYFGVYSKTTPFLESAVHALFRRYSPIGAPPVDVPGTRFASLSERLLPNPDVTIPLSLESSDGAAIASNTTATPAEDRAEIDTGTLLRLRVGPILDHNGHQVPDGTVVAFDLRYEGEEVALMMEPALTRGGMAAREVTPDRGGILRVSARAGQASTGDEIAVVVIQPPGPAAQSNGATADAGTSTAAGDTGQPGSPNADDARRVDFVTLAIALATLVIAVSLLLIVQVRVLPRSTLVHNMLWATIFGLAGYVLYGIGLFPGGDWLAELPGRFGIPVTVFVPMLLPLLWLQVRGDDRDR